eukprot:COSAG06_NODE_11174_length_1551_cov_1.508953_4_plen_76_part_01
MHPGPDAAPFALNVTDLPFMLPYNSRVPINDRSILNYSIHRNAIGRGALDREKKVCRKRKVVRGLGSDQAAWPRGR